MLKYTLFIDDAGDILLKNNCMDKFMWVRLSGCVNTYSLDSKSSWFSRERIGYPLKETTHSFDDIDYVKEAIKEFELLIMLTK